jgi:predicted metal-dependent phosphoesterase TrpH
MYIMAPWSFGCQRYLKLQGQLLGNKCRFQTLTGRSMANDLDRSSNDPAREVGKRQVEQLPEELVKQIEKIGAVPSPGGRLEPGTIKIDLHCHSEASADCSTPLELIPARCRARRVNVQAITDHNQVWGAQKLKEIVARQPDGLSSSLTVIVGEEVSTTEGEIIGLFLEELVPAGMTPEATVERIKAQGGLVLLPHGFDPLKRWRLKQAALNRIADQVDIVETFNARISRPSWNRAAVSWAEVHQRAMSAGSDAHVLADIGSAWVEVPQQAIRTPQDLLNALKHGVPVGVWTHPVLAYIFKFWDRTRRRFFSR